MKTLYSFSLKRPFLLFTFLWITWMSGEAKNSFVLHCPPNKYITCTDDMYNLSRFGNATYSLNYITYSAGMPVVQYHLNSCQVGYITRTWSVEDPYWNVHTCTQTIYVSQANNNPIQIAWPPDYEVEGCTPNVKPNQLPPPYNSPTWTGDECRMIGKSYSDMVFTVNNGCKKIMRTWKLIDWCDNNGWGTQWTHNQIIKIINEERPVVHCPGEINGNSFNCKDAQINAPPLQVGPTSCGGNAVISNNSPYSTQKGADLSGVYPIGTTKVTYTIQYGCGSRLYCHVNVVVKNASAPSAYCLHGIVTTLMPIDTNGDGTPDDGMVDVWAKDLDRGSKSLCNYYPLRYSFSSDPTDMFRRFTCDEVGQNGVMVFITDSKGGQSACMVNIDIQNNSANIPNCTRKVDPPHDSLLISQEGSLRNAFDEAMVAAEIGLTFHEGDMHIVTTYDTIEVIKKDSFYNASGYLLYFFKKEQTITETKDTSYTFENDKTYSDENGNFTFDSLKNSNKSFSLTVNYSEAPRKNIDGKDVEFLTKFLLGEVQFTKPYQFVAADIDENKIIDITDLNLLLNFVTAVTNQLPGASWHYLNSEFQIDEPGNILKNEWPELSFENESKRIRITGIKKGDITRDGQLQNEIVELRNNNVKENVCTIYPNPSVDELRIFNKTPGKLSLLNSAGNELLILELLTSEHHVINPEFISTLPAGLYMFRFESPEGNKYGKWIKL